MKLHGANLNSLISRLAKGKFTMNKRKKSMLYSMLAALLFGGASVFFWYGFRTSNDGTTLFAALACTVASVANFISFLRALKRDK